MCCYSRTDLSDSCSDSLFFLLRVLRVLRGELTCFVQRPRSIRISPALHLRGEVATWAAITHARRSARRGSIPAFRRSGPSPDMEGFVSRRLQPEEGHSFMALPEFTMRQLLEAGAHFGHQTHRWNPK